MAFAILVIIFEVDGAVDRLIGLQPFQQFFVVIIYFYLSFLNIAFVETANPVLL